MVHVLNLSSSCICALYRSILLSLRRFEFVLSLFIMGKQKKCSNSNHGSKKHRPRLVQGSFGKACVEDSFDSSRTCFRSAISSLKDVEFDLYDLSD